MKKLSNRAKKWLVISGAWLACMIMLALIGARLKTPPPVDEPLPSSSEESQEVKPTVQTINDKEYVIPSSSKPPMPSEIEEPAISSGKEQTIQPDPINPSEPEKPEKADVSKPHDVPKDPELTNPSSKPAPKEPEAQKQAPQKPTVPAKPAKPSEPKNGDTKDGKIFVDGFGWVENHGGGSIGTFVDGDGDINKQVGQMG